MIMRELERRIHGMAYLGLQGLRGRPVGAFISRLQAWEALDRPTFQQVCRERLEQSLAYAHRTVPLYSSARWRQALSHARTTEVHAWPILERHLIRARGPELHARPRPHGTFYRQSSASSGKPLRVAYDPQAGAWSWANEYRAMLWFGVAPGARTLMLWGIRHPVLDWIRNARVFLTFELTPERLEQAAQYVLTRKPQLWVALPSAAAQLARYIRSRYPDAPARLAPFVKLGGEQIYPFEREQIETHLGARVVESYGCTEVGAIAMECPAGSLHIFSEHVHVETFRDDTPLPAGEIGDIVVTSLANRAMPLVRCRIGDRGRISPEPCACGLPHPVLTDLAGRAADTFPACDGTLVHGSVIGRGLQSFLSKAPLGAVRQVLFEQIDQRRWRVLVETGSGFGAPLAAQLADIVRGAFGRECRVDVQPVAVIPREPSGKFRYYRSSGTPVQTSSFVEQELLSPPTSLGAR
jgi:phenylacetate-CoA ligase